WVEALRADPGGEGQGGDEPASDLLKRILGAFDAGASAVFASLDFAPPEPKGPTAGMPLGAELLVRLHSALAAGSRRLPAPDRVAFGGASGTPSAAIHAVAFYEPKEGVAAIAVWPTEGFAGGRVAAKIIARRPGPPVLYDPIAGTQTQPTFQAVPEGGRGT